MIFGTSPIIIEQHVRKRKSQFTAKHNSLLLLLLFDDVLILYNALQAKYCYFNN